MKSNKQKLAALAGVASGALAALPAHAAIDVSSIVTDIGEYAGNSGPIASIGVAILGVVMVVLAISFVKRVMK